MLGGRKVRSFYRNIAFPTSSHDVTLDTWMLHALVPDEYYAHLATSYSFLSRAGVYDAVSDAIREIADDRGELAHEVQATIWIHVRGSHD